MELFIALFFTVFLIGAITAIVGMVIDNEKTVFVGGSIVIVVVAVYFALLLFNLWAWALA